MELSDIQRVIAIGPYVKDTFGVGDWVKINMARFVKPKKVKSLRDGDEFDSTTLEYYIPLETFGGEDYLLIDQGDVEYYWSGDAYKN